MRQRGSAIPPELLLPVPSFVVTLPAWPPPVATAFAPPVPAPPSSVPAPPQRRRVWPWVVGAFGVIAIAVTVGLTLLAVRDHHHYPKAWDAKIAPIVAFVEKHRGLTYTHAVPVEYLPDKEFEALVTGQDSAVADPSDADSEASLRALGLIAGDTKLQQDSTKIQSSGVLAFYSDREEKVVVRGTGALDAGTRVILAHELTHALQDQHFDLNKLRTEAAAGGDLAVLSLIEGDAVSIENEYYSSLSTADQTAYDVAQAKDYGEFQAAIADVAPVLSLEFDAPYEFGPAFVAALRDDGGYGRVDEAFADPPTSMEQVMWPARYLAGRDPLAVDIPKSIETESELFPPEPLGAFETFLVLAQRLDPKVALTAARGWRGDEALVIKKKDGTVCVRENVVGDSAATTKVIGDAYKAWAAAGPKDLVTVASENGHVLVTACDPGKAVPKAANGVESLRLPMQRAVYVTQLLDSVNLKTADCVIDRMADVLTVSQFVNPDDPVFATQQFTDGLDASFTACQA